MARMQTKSQEVQIDKYAGWHSYMLSKTSHSDYIIGVQLGQNADFYQHLVM